MLAVMLAPALINGEGCTEEADAFSLCRALANVMRELGETLGRDLLGVVVVLIATPRELDAFAVIPAFGSNRLTFGELFRLCELGLIFMPCAHMCIMQV